MEGLVIIANHSGAMSTFDTDIPPSPPPSLRRAWKFVGTSLWGLFIFAAMFLGQSAIVG